MGFYLQIEIDSTLSPAEFRERVIAPIIVALERDKLGRLLPDPVEDDPPKGMYQLALEVTDQQRVRTLVEELLRSIDS
jgi:hypothetical protein